MKKYILLIMLLLLSVLCSCKEKEEYKVIDKVEATVNYDNYSVNSDITCEVIGRKDVEYITLTFTLYQKNMFHKDTSLYINGEKIKDGYDISGDGHQLTYRYLNPYYEEDPNKVLSEIRFTLDTLNYIGVSGNNDAYKIKVETDNKYTYVTTTIAMNLGYKIADEFTLYVNDKVVDDNYIINEDRTELIYKIKDPNWTPTY